VKPTLGVELAERLRRQVEAKTPQTRLVRSIQK